MIKLTLLIAAALVLCASSARAEASGSVTV